MKRKHASKVVAAAMTAAMMVSMLGVTAFAAENKTEDSTTVKYEVTEEYTWSVPSEIDFTGDEDATITTSGTSGATQDVYVSKNVIKNGKKLNIALKDATNNTFKIKSAEGAELTYAVNTLAAGDTVLEVPAGTNTGEATLTFKLTKDSVEKAGSYSGTLSYVATIIAQ